MKRGDVLSLKLVKLKGDCLFVIPKRNDDLKVYDVCMCDVTFDEGRVYIYFPESNNLRPKKPPPLLREEDDLEPKSPPLRFVWPMFQVPFGS